MADDETGFDEVHEQLPGFHKIHRNRKQIIVSTNEDNSAFITSSRYDNFNIITDPHTAVGYSVGKKILNPKIWH